MRSGVFSIKALTAGDVPFAEQVEDVLRLRRDGQGQQGDAGR